MKAKTLKLVLAAGAALVAAAVVRAEVKLLESIKIADDGLYFDGESVPVKDRLTVGDGPKYDYAFGPRITPHGDCIETFGDFVFMTWYKGPEAKRNVMLTRYNMKTKQLATIEFEHRHTGFQNRPHVGESHNTIAVGICPIDETIHLLYDMHSYSPDRPEDGSLAKDYFRYQVSVKGAASASDEAFTRELFGDKRLYLAKGEDYTALTYPYFHVNELGELFVRIRRGGNDNGKYMLAKYDGEKWSRFWDFNVIDAKRHGQPHNWGLYGDLKFENGKLRAGFATRYANKKDRYIYNNGFHYAYSNDPEGRSKWFNYQDKPVSLPIVDPKVIKFYEPCDVFDSQAPNSLHLTGVDWTVTSDDSLHFITRVQLREKGKKDARNVHAYKKVGDKEFSISSDFPGGELYSVGNVVYLMGLEKGRPYVYSAPGGTDDWTLLYRAKDGPKFMHGNVIIADGKLFYYLMEEGEGSARPTHLLIYQLY